MKLKRGMSLSDLRISGSETEASKGAAEKPHLSNIESLRYIIYISEDVCVQNGTKCNNVGKLSYLRIRLEVTSMCRNCTATLLAPGTVSVTHSR